MGRCHSWAAVSLGGRVLVDWRDEGDAIVLAWKEISSLGNGSVLAAT
jgi:hypothetical protein